MLAFAVSSKPEQTRRAVEAGKLPAIGTGPREEDSLRATFCDFVVARAAKDGPAAHCRVRAKAGVGYGHVARTVT